MIDNTRLAGADFIRAAACMIVLGHHLSQRMSWSHALGWMEWMRVFTQIGGFGVAMFFVLSGYLLAQPFWTALDAGRPMPSLRTYALRRAARILPGFWLALTVTFVLTVTAFGIALTPELVLRYLSGVFLVADWHWVTFFPVEVNGPMWSISFEVTSYVLLPFGFLALFALAGRLGQGWRTRLLWLGVIAAALLAHYAFTRFVHPGSLRRGWDYGLQGGAKFWMPKFNPFGFFAMFAIGALASGVQTQIVKWRHALWDVVALAAILAGGWMLARQTSATGTESYGLLGVPHAYPWFQLAIGLALAALPSTVVVGRLLDNPVVRYLARVSFGVYVWHYVVLELVRLWIAPDIDHGQMDDPLRMAWVSGLIVAISFAIADLSYRYLEAPIIAWARGLERRGVPSASPTLSPAAG
jgi:peptidoglycan/LPS O-acetylase OafA/YrhL